MWLTIKLSKYRVVNFTALAKLADKLPEAYKEQLITLVCKRHLMSNTTDLASWSMGTVIAMRHSSWL